VKLLHLPELADGAAVLFLRPQEHASRKTADDSLNCGCTRAIARVLANQREWDKEVESLNHVAAGWILTAEGGQANHFAAVVEGRAAAVAVVDYRIGLDGLPTSGGSLAAAYGFRR
jgi:hypothetical protein